MRKLFRNLDRSVGKVATTSVAALDAVQRLVRPRRHSQPGKVGSILAIKLVGLGDTVLMLTALNRLRESMPHARISVLVTPLSRGIIEGQPQVDRVIVYDVFGKDKGIRGLLRLVRTLKQLSPDCIIDFEQHFQATALLSYLVGSRMRIGLYYHGNPRKLLLTDPIFFDPEVHMVVSYLRLLEPLGIKAHVPSRLTPIAITAEDRQRVDKWLDSLGLDSQPLVGIHTGSGIRAPAKRWAAERFAGLISHLTSQGSAVVLTGSADEFDHCEAIAQQAGETDVYNTAGMFTIKQTAHLISRCSLFISNDTGPMHISAAMGTPTIGLFGPESPQRYGPFGEHNRIVYKGAPCSPCVEIYRGYAPDCRRPICMENIEIKDVLEAVTQYHLENLR